MTCWHKRGPRPSWHLILLAGPPEAGRVAGGVERGGWPLASRSPPGPARSAANVKKWEMELQTLRESNARLTAALQESAASVEQWKRQFSICRDENDQLRTKVRDGPILLLSPLPSLAPLPVAGGRRAVAPL